MGWIRRNKGEASTSIPSSRQRSGRTTIGTPQVYSYHTRRSQEFGAFGRRLFREALSARTAARATKYWLRRIGLLVIAAAIIVSLVNALILSADPRVLPLDPRQTYFLHSMSVYQRATQKLLAGSILNYNKVTINSAEVSRRLQQEFPELAVVSIKLPLVGHRPIVYIAPTRPVLLLKTRYQQIYVIDENGRALALDKNLPEPGLVTVEDDSGTDIHVGQLALSKATVSFIRVILYQLQAEQLVVSKLVLSDGESGLDIYLNGQSYLVKCNIVAGKPEQQVGAFLAVRQHLSERGTVPAKYIDVRILGRAYYQ